MYRLWAPHEPRPTKEFPSLNRQAVTHLRSATPVERESWLDKRLPPLHEHVLLLSAMRSR